jgi:multiple sugar transport system permease protein
MMAPNGTPGGLADSVAAGGGRLADALGPRLTRRIGVATTLPTQLLLIFIIAFPTLVTVYISLTAWTPLDGVTWVKAYTSWSWFDNYIEIFQDGRLGGAIARTLFLVAIAVAAEFLLGFALALLFVDKFAFRPVYYSLFLLPMMVVPAVSGYMFLILFQSTGPINQLIGFLIGHPFEMVWLTNRTTATIAVIAADVWQWTPMMFLILLAGLIGVPQDQIKAARLLGASWGQILTRISLPRIRAVIVIAIGIRFIEALKLFDVMFIMTKGGPGVATETVSLYLYKRTFGDLEWAYVAAIGLTIVIVMSLAAVGTLFVLRRLRRFRTVAP